MAELFKLSLIRRTELVAGAMLLLALIISGMAWRDRAAAVADYQQAHALASWLDAQRETVTQAQQGAARQGSELSGSSLLAMVNESAMAAGLGVQRIEPGDKDIKVWLEVERFALAVAWLEELESRKLHVKQLNIEHAAKEISAPLALNAVVELR